MSMRQKLIISNIIMVLIPTIFLVSLNSRLQRDLRKQMISQRETVLDISPLRQITDAPIQFEELILHCQTLEQNGCSVLLRDQQTILYESIDYYEKARKITGNIEEYDGIAQLIQTGANGSELYIKIGGEDSTTELSVITNKTIPNNIIHNEREVEFETAMQNNTFILIFSTLFIIIVINWILTKVVSRSVLNPLQILQEGTNRIKQGDLEHEVIYDKKDEFGAVCANFEDMRLRLQQSVLEQTKYEESKKELIAGISHDLLTPITRIKGYVAGILDGVANTPEKINYYLNTINSTTDAMRKIVDDLFLFSKLDIKSIPFYFERTNLIIYFDDCCQELAVEMDKHDIDLVFKPHADEAFVMLERSQFKRAILNIIDNSVKYKKEGRGNIIITIEKKDTNMEISFKDCGIGVDEKKLPLLFDIFYRTDSARSDPQKGSGLGLAIVKQIVELHDGKVSCRSENGNGLTIIILLPI